MLTHGLRTLLLAQSAITSLAPAQVVGRTTYPAVFCDNAPQGVQPPYVVFHANATDPMVTLDATYSESLKSDDIEIDVVGYSVPQARTLSETIRQYFDDYLGFFAAGTNSATADLLNSTNGSFAVVGQADGVKGVKLPSFTGTYQVANIQQSYSLYVYLPNGTQTTVAAASTGLYTNTSGTYSQTSVTATTEPSDVVHAVIWQDEGYSYDFPDEGRDTKHHIITTSYQIQSEQGV